MSKETKPTKVVKITENELVTLIDNIVKEAVTIKKKEWIAEQAKTTGDKTQLLEARLEKLEKALSGKVTEKPAEKKAVEKVAEKATK